MKLALEAFDVGAFAFLAYAFPDARPVPFGINVPSHSGVRVVARLLSPSCCEGSEVYYRIEVYRESGPRVAAADVRIKYDGRELRHCIVLGNYNSAYIFSDAIKAALRKRILERFVQPALALDSFGCALKRLVQPARALDAVERPRARRARVEELQRKCVVTTSLTGGTKPHFFVHGTAMPGGSHVSAKLSWPPCAGSQSDSDNDDDASSPPATAAVFVPHDLQSTPHDALDVCRLNMNVTARHGTRMYAFEYARHVLVVEVCHATDANVFTLTHAPHMRLRCTTPQRGHVLATGELEPLPRDE